MVVSDVLTPRRPVVDAEMKEKLIIAVCGYLELYDTTCLLCRDRNKKEQAWVKVAEETGLLGKFCKYVCLISLQNDCTMNVSTSLAPVSTAGFPATRANDAMKRMNKMVRRLNPRVTRVQFASLASGVNTQLRPVWRGQ